MDYTFWVPLAATGLNLYLTHRQVRFMEAQAGTTPLPRLTIPARLGRYWPIATMFILMLGCWVPYFLAAKPQPELFLEYGYKGDRIYALLRTIELAERKGNSRLMMVAMVADSAVDYKTDTRIAKSSTFEIGEFSTMIEIVLTPEIRATLNRPGTVQLYILEVPPELPFELIRNLKDAQKLGGKILGAKGFGGL
jgi:hypothetical protein